MNNRDTYFTPRRIIEMITPLIPNIPRDRKNHEFIDPNGFHPSDEDVFLVRLISEAIDPQDNRTDADDLWRPVEAALSELLTKQDEGAGDLSPAWKSIDERAAVRSLYRARRGDLGPLNCRLRTPHLRLSQGEKNYLADRNEGKVLRNRGAPKQGAGRYYFARLWLEVVDKVKKRDAASRQVEVHFNKSQRSVEASATCMKNIAGG